MSICKDVGIYMCVCMCVFLFVFTSIYTYIMFIKIYILYVHKSNLLFNK